MLLVQKIFYFHVPSWFVMFTAISISGIYSGIYLFKGDRSADRIAACGGRDCRRFRHHGPGDRSACGGARPGASGGSGTRSSRWRCSSKSSSSATCWCGSTVVPGSEKMGAALAVFGMLNVPVRLLVGQYLADGSPEDERRPDARAPACSARSGSA